MAIDTELWPLEWRYMFNFMLEPSTYKKNDSYYSLVLLEDGCFCSTDGHRMHFYENKTFTRIIKTKKWCVEKNTLKQAILAESNFMFPDLSELRAGIQEILNNDILLKLPYDRTISYWYTKIIRSLNKVYINIEYLEPIYKCCQKLKSNINIYIDSKSNMLYFTFEKKKEINAVVMLIND